MKKGKRLLSMVLSASLCTSLLPNSALLNNADAAPSRRTDGISQAQTPSEAIRSERSQSTVIASNNYADYDWEHVGNGAGKIDDNIGALRALLESSETKKIILTEDITEHYQKSVWEDIVVNSDKILDLNGHTVKFSDDTNRTGDYKQSTNSDDLRDTLISIKSGTLTIIDSSKEQTGGMIIDGYMIDPYKHRIKNHTTRDLFNVSGGNLVIYGGTFRAGRSKNQYEDSFNAKNLKTVIGSAVTLATNIAGYATGINTAKSAFDTASSTFDQIKAAAAKTNNEDDKDNSDEEQKNISTPKKTDSNPDNKNDSEVPAPDGQNNTREETKNEKLKKITDNNNKDKDNDDKGSDGKNGDGKNKSDNDKKGEDKVADAASAVTKAENGIVDAVIDEKTITPMVTEAFKLADNIINLFEKNDNTLVTQSFLGTVAKVGNGSTFVCYGGNFIGYGMTTSERNAVIEVAEEGQAYIFDGTFEGRAGANVFNEIKFISNYGASENTVQYTVEKTEDGIKKTPKTVTLPDCETGGARALILDPSDDTKLVDTSNITVRGGTFRTNSELIMLGLNESNEGTNDHNTDTITVFPGTPGCVNLGAESYDENYIRDGRIQIIDDWGDGKLVLMDEELMDDDVYHYSLFCTDPELRHKEYLTVKPNHIGEIDSNGNIIKRDEALTNSSHSIVLQTRYNNGDAADAGELEGMMSWCDNNGSTNLPYKEEMTEDEKQQYKNVRGIYGSDEKYFIYEFDSNQKGKYFVAPQNSEVDVDGKIIGSSDTWYYKTPLDYDGKEIDTFVDTDVLFKGNTDTGYNTAYSKDCHSLEYAAYKFRYNEELTRYTGDDRFSKEHNNMNDQVAAAAFDKVLNAAQKTNNYIYGVKQNYASCLRWVNVEVYRVDPLTRENVNSDGTRLSNSQNAEPVYSNSFGSKSGYANPFYLKDFGINYKAGEMYRVVFNVDEYCKFGNIKGDFEKQLPVASATSSILFLCASQDEQTDEDSSSIFNTSDYTPLQWIDPPLPDNVAKVEIVNGSADRRDYLGRRLFDVYYQWFAVDPQTGNETQFAGITGNNSEEIFDDTTLKGAANYQFHLLKLDDTTDSDGVLHKGVRNDFLNTVKPSDTNTYDSNGLPHDPKEWTSEMVHAYTDRTISDLEDNKALSNNSYLYSATDTCYIPKEYKGYDIYVKAIVINNFWPKNYDHKQTFTSHKYLSEVSDDKLMFDVTKVHNLINELNESGKTVKTVVFTSNKNIPENAVSLNSSNTVKGFVQNGTELYITTVFKDRKVVAPKSLNELFRVKEIDGINEATITDIIFDGLNTQYVKSMYAMFDGQDKLESLDLSTFNTENVTDMSNMFAGCESLKTLDLSSFDTSKVKDMSYMFGWCSSLTNLNASSFNTENVTNMRNMFSNCTSLKILNIPNFKTPKVTNIFCMFSSSAIVQLDIAGFDISSVTNFGSMFSSSSNISYIFCTDKQLEAFKNKGGLVSSATNRVSGHDSSSSLLLNNQKKYCTFDKDMLRSEIEQFISDGIGIKKLAFVKYMEVYDDAVPLNSVGGVIAYRDAKGTMYVTQKYGENFSLYAPEDCSELFSEFDIPEFDFTGLDTSGVTNMSGMFSGNSAVKKLNLLSLKTSNVTDMSNMFNECTNLESADLSGFDTQKVTSMERMFMNAPSLNSIDVSSFNTSSVTNMSAMFGLNKKLNAIDISTFDLSNVEKADMMFRSCTSLKSIKMPQNTNTDKCRDFSYMFSEDGALESIDLTAVTTSNADTMQDMFSGCKSLKSLDLSGFVTDNVKVTSEMFKDCTALETIDLRNFTTKNASDMSGMFENCSSVKELDLKGFDLSSVTKMDKMFAGADSIEKIDCSAENFEKYQSDGGLREEAETLTTTTTSTTTTSTTTTSTTTTSTTTTSTTTTSTTTTTTTTTTTSTTTTSTTTTSTTTTSTTTTSTTTTSTTTTSTTTTSTTTTTTTTTTTSTTTTSTTTTTTTTTTTSTTTTSTTTTTTDKPDKTPGDANGDGSVALKDVVLIRRFIAGGWNVSLDISVADVNDDGTVNLKDVVLIRRFIAGGYNVTLLSSTPKN